MCGIAGILRFDGAPADARGAERMARVLAHRGPDGQGIHTEGSLVLAHRALHIIDLSPRSAQPMPNEDLTIWLVHNGEIYNFIELKPELQARGHSFRSACDSELILHAYEEEGEDCVHRFNGMWAFAVWDSKRRRLFLSRDRLGEKPLYYVIDSHGIAFASEVKALLALRGDLTEPSTGEMAQFLAAGMIDAGDEATFFRRIVQLPPGHNLLVTADGRHEVRRYWSPPEPHEVEMRTLDQAAVVFGELLADSIRLRLRSDVPLGASLSGGIDSSSILSLMCRLMESHSIHTFSAFFEPPEDTEKAYIDVMTSSFPTIAHHVIPAPNFLELLPRLIWHHEVPFTGPGIYPQWCVMGLAKGKVRVLFSGQGADELLGGYYYYYADHFGDLMRRMPHPLAIRDLLVALVRVPRRLSLRDTLGVLREGVSRVQGKPREAGYKAGWITHYLTSDVAREAREFLGPPSLNGAGFLPTVLHTEVTRTSLPMMLHSEDRNSMAHGIESRVPFLDHRLVEFCLRLPGRLRIQAGLTKAPLRRAMGPQLPEKVARRVDKKGFREPLAQWLREGAHHQVEDILLSKRLRERGVLRADRLEEDLREHMAGADRTIPLYRALTLEMWFRNFVDGEGLSRFASDLEYAEKGIPDPAR
jgi:asparagine synthase (glutamine-hydrolysing)